MLSLEDAAVCRPSPERYRVVTRRPGGRHEDVLRHGGCSGGSGPDRPVSVEALFTGALRDGTRCVDLDDSLVARLQLDDLSVSNAPLSLDLTVVVGAASRAALDAGRFQLAIGPNVGSMAAGRMVGRFADLVPGTDDALRRVAASEAARTPGRLLAELSYAPRSARLMNVSVRPDVRAYEVAIGVTPGADPTRTIPVDELAIGVRGGRFMLRWLTTGEEVVLCAGHMLSSARAPLVARFLSEVGRDGVCQLSGFNWGPAAGFPFLPRVRSGRVILSLARWRLAAEALPTSTADDPAAFEAALDGWRKRWGAPSQLAIVSGDHRLPLDLTRASDVDELRRVVRRSRAATVLTEVFPDPDEVWVTDEAGRRFVAELVVPLVRRATAREPSPAAAVSPRRPRPAADVRPPGSDWLFLKLYTGREMEDDLLAGPVHDFVEEAAGRGFRSFFLRYSDPARHVRLRFRGEPERLVGELFPLVTTWATGLMRRGECARFALDTYERELERFGVRTGRPRRRRCSSPTAGGRRAAPPAGRARHHARSPGRRRADRRRLARRFRARRQRPGRMVPSARRVGEGVGRRLPDVEGGAPAAARPPGRSGPARRTARAAPCRGRISIGGPRAPARGGGAHVLAGRRPPQHHPPPSEPAVGRRRHHRAAGLRPPRAPPRRARRLPAVASTRSASPTGSSRPSGGTVQGRDVGDRRVR